MLVRNKSAEPTAIGLAPNRALAENAKHFTSQPAKHFSSQSFCWQGFWRNRRQSYWCNPQSFLALGHLHPCGYLRSLTGAGNPLAQAYHRAPAPRRTALPPPGLLLRHFLRQDIIFRRHRLAFGSWTCCLCLCSWHHKTCHTRNLWLHFAAALLLPNQGQTNALDPTTTQKKGDGFG